jgi:hypothetical protein
MGFVGYETPIPQNDYLLFGLVSAIIGFFLLSYFCMYSYYNRDIKLHSRKIKEN